MRSSARSHGLRALPRRLNATFQTRSFHVAKARFVTVDDEGTATRSETEIRIGDPDQAFVYIEPRLGDAIRSAVAQQTGLQSTHDLKKLPMVFHHASRHFSHGLLVPRA